MTWVHGQVLAGFSHSAIIISATQPSRALSPDRV